MIGSDAETMSLTVNRASAEALDPALSTTQLAVAPPRSSAFTLSAVDITRQTAWQGDALQSARVNGTHTLSGTLVNGSFSYTVATQGSVSYTADGLPSADAWTLTRPTRQLGISAANGTATITIDNGKDGMIDRTVTVPVSQLATDAG